MCYQNRIIIDMIWDKHLESSETQSIPTNWDTVGAIKSGRVISKIEIKITLCFCTTGSPITNESYHQQISR